jgi:hypothetical protein
MKLTRTITLAIVAGIGPVAAATLPLDRPTPPPCCVDGICTVHAAEFGYHPTRWRVWPGLSQAPLPTVQQPTIRNIPGIPAIETPKPEEEDRQAPPPIRSLAPPRPVTETSPPTGGAPGATPQTAPFDTNNGLGSGGATPTSPLTPRSGAPGTTTPPGLPQPSLPFGNEPSSTPSSPLDFPFSPSASLNTPATQAYATTSPTAGIVRTASSAASAPLPARRSHNDDPPPAPPFIRGGGAF